MYFFFGKWLLFAIEIPISETKLILRGDCWCSDTVSDENVPFLTGYIPKAWICKTLSLQLDK